MTLFMFVEAEEKEHGVSVKDMARMVSLRFSS